MSNKLKGYLWIPDEDGEFGIAVIAETNREARKLGYTWWGEQCGHDDPDSFILQRCRLIKGPIRIDDLEKGVLSDGKEGLRRGLYGFVEDERCDVCKKKRTLYQYKNLVVCNDCIESMPEEDKE